MSTHLITSPTFLAHDMGAGHPERPERITTVRAAIDAAALPGLLVVEAEAAPVAAILAVHDADHEERIRILSSTGRSVPVTPDTVVGPHTYTAAVHASGAALAGVDAVLAGQADNAFCLLRPPGHHAERDAALGFCFFNHVAIAARHLQRRHGLARIAIVDWDVHHGNGTQHSFYDDGEVFYFSIHQSPLFPGTGADDETGAGTGAGTTVNVPMAAGSGDAEYLEVFRQRLVPALRGFAPEFLLVSAGFDAHHRDPLADMRLTAQGFGALTVEVRRLADELCGGRLVSLFEGGYDLEATAASVTAHLRVLAQG